MSKSLALKELPFTGERLVTQPASGRVQIIFEHLHRYFLATECCRGKQVLDIACGEGYGSNILAQTATSVVGVDIAADVIKYASRKYRRDNLHFKTGNCTKIPLPSHSVDVVVSFETIEHLAAHEAFLTEIRRVLRPRGVMIMSSPDKSEYTDRLDQHNPFHVAELYRHDFLGLLKRHFKNCRGLQQRLVGGSYIAADEHPTGDKSVYGTHRGDFQGGSFSEGLPAGLYVLAVCSDGPLPPLRLGVLENRHESARMWDSYETAGGLREELNTLRVKINESDGSLALTTQARDRLETELRHAQRELEILQNHTKWLEDEVARLRPDPTAAVVAIAEVPGRGEADWSELKAKLAAQEQKITELESEVVRRGDWGKQLDLDLAMMRERLVLQEKAREELVNQIQIRDAEILNLCASIDPLRAERDRLNLQLSQAAFTLTQVEQKSSHQHEAARLEHDRLAQKLADLSQREETDREELTRLQEEQTALHASLADSLKARSAMENELRSVQVQFDGLTKELSERTHWAQSLDAELQHARVAFAEQAGLATERTQWAQSLDADLTKARAALSVQTELVETRTAWAKSLDKELSNARALLAEESKRVSERSVYVKSLEVELVSTRATMAEQAKLLEERSVWGKSLERELRSTQDKIAALTGDHARQTQRFESLNLELQGARLALAEQTRLVRAHADQVHSLETDAQSTQAQLAILTKEHLEHAARAQSVNANLLSARAALAEQTKRVEERDAQVKSLNTKLDASRAEEARQVHERAQAMSRAQSLETDLQQARADLNERDHQIAAGSTERDALNTKIAGLKQLNNELGLELAGLKAACVSLSKVLSGDLGKGEVALLSTCEMALADLRLDLANKNAEANKTAGTALDAQMRAEAAESEVRRLARTVTVAQVHVDHLLEVARRLQQAVNLLEEEKLATKSTLHQREQSLLSTLSELEISRSELEITRKKLANYESRLICRMAVRLSSPSGPGTSPP